MCDVCHNESCTEDIGVACIPGVPMSIMWGNKCLNNPLGIVVPSHTIEYHFIFGGMGNVENLADWCKELYTWADGKYMKFDEYVKRISMEQVQKELDDYEQYIASKED